MKEMKLYKSRNWLYQKYWNENLNSCEMAKLCNISPKNIRLWMEKFNIKRRNKEEVGTLTNFFLKNGETYEEKYGIVKAEKIKKKLRMAFLKYEFNEKTFDILTPQIAYWLGFIYADGCVNPKQNKLIICLNEKDKIILEEFKISLNSNHPIHSYPYFDGRLKVILNIHSNYLIKRLNELGVYQNKTKIIKFPTFLSDNLYSDFIRGYFDGDGSLYFRKIDKQWRFAITSNSFFITEIQRILMENCCLKKTKLYSIKGTISKTMKYGGNKQIKRIINYLIQNKGFYLPRKIGRWLPRQTYS